MGKKMSSVVAKEDEIILVSGGRSKRFGFICCAYRSVEANRPSSPIRVQSTYKPTPQRKPPPKPSGANIYKVCVCPKCLFQLPTKDQHLMYVRVFVCECCPAAKCFLAFLGVTGLFWSRRLTAGLDMCSDPGFANIVCNHSVCQLYGQV